MKTDIFLKCETCGSTNPSRIKASRDGNYLLHMDCAKEDRFPSGGRLLPSTILESVTIFLRKDQRMGLTGSAILKEKEDAKRAGERAERARIRRELLEAIPVEPEPPEDLFMRLYDHEGARFSATDQAQVACMWFREQVDRICPEGKE